MIVIINKIYLNEFLVYIENDGIKRRIRRQKSD